MHRGAHTRGRITAATEGVESVEVKATITDRQIPLALRRYGLKPSKKDERYVYFFDTPALDLLKAGIIARARRVVGEDHDSTIKFRPVEPAQVPTLWLKYKGFKFEADASAKGIIKSASLTMPVAKGVIKRVVSGSEPVARLFTEEQLSFLFALCRKQLDYSRVVVLGPVQAWRWKFQDPALPWAMTGELWLRDDKARLLEASIKVPVEQAAVAVAGFEAFLAEIGAESDEGQQAKTHWVLDHFAKKLQGSRKANPRTGAAAVSPLRKTTNRS